MLAAACYGERNEAPEASGQGGGAHAAGYSWQELTQRVQCSNKELTAALRRLQAMEKDGRWMTLEPGAFLGAKRVMMKAWRAADASVASVAQHTCAACWTS